MKILHTESSCGWGGQEMRVLAEARGLSLRGHTVSLACPAEARIAEEARRLGIFTHILPIERKTLPGLFAMRGLLRREQFDVINTHSSTDSWLSALSLIGIAPASVSGKRAALVRTRHISAPLKRNAATRWLYASAARHVVTTGEALRLEVIDACGAASDAVTSVPTGIDLERFSPGDQHSARAQLRLPTAARLITIAATLRSWKGHATLIDALAQLPEDAHLAVVGDGPGRDNVRAQAASLKLESRVHFAGQQRDIVPWLHAADVFCLPSYANEGVPQALMQAMACALPVVTTNIGAIGEIVTDGETGLFATPRDVASVASTLRRALDDAPLRERLSAAALKQAQTRFGEARMLDAMEAIFSKAAR
jgi:glycosyltransferase involved in cell wall biosynthesis